MRKSRQVTVPVSNLKTRFVFRNQRKKWAAALLKNMPTSVDEVKEFIDITFPEVGTECPNLPVMVVLFSAALLGNASPLISRGVHWV